MRLQRISGFVISIVSAHTQRRWKADFPQTAIPMIPNSVRTNQIKSKTVIIGFRALLMVMNIVSKSEKTYRCPITCRMRINRNARSEKEDVPAKATAFIVSNT